MTEECRSQFGVLFNNVGIIFNTRVAERKSCGDRGASVIVRVLFLIPVSQSESRAEGASRADKVNEN